MGHNDDDNDDDNDDVDCRTNDDDDEAEYVFIKKHLSIVAAAAYFRSFTSFFL